MSLTMSPFGGARRLLSLSVLLVLGMLALLALQADVAQAKGADYYALLGVSRGSSAADIKKAFRAKSREYHPDKNPGDRAAAELYMQINAAYEILNDPEKKAVYDQYGEEGLTKMQQQQQQGGGGDGMWDPFGFFGGMFGHNQGHGHAHGARGGIPKGPDSYIEVPVSLADIFSGREIPLLLNQQHACPKCSGTGAKSPEHVGECKVCKGQGSTVGQEQVAPGMFIQRRQTCRSCAGRGRVITQTCAACGGKRVERGERRIVLTVEPGVPDGHMVTFDSQADFHPDHMPGSLLIKLSTEPHPLFERPIKKAPHLLMNVELTLREALLGFDKEFTHLDGSKFKVSRQPAGPGATVAPVQHNERMRLPGLGLPVHEGGASERGFLEVVFTVALPKKPVASKEAAEQLAKAFDAAGF
ncbi:hypothetical protein H696_05509 [Fonticula alba]|uniref:Chaperone DnaJ n=1 Tax=Fonticula alba TaxID=691883 RepID=A0A058Z2A3_FONAL|nr:hypothetical protein H696_05509 [Fonticula alba]KCV68043.1 hypothetical protein H696_05509 [Fonticula alba]|eukprot:XP_009497610.1 hypothetical protein H696_05509 [Fonticula alba]